MRILASNPDNIGDLVLRQPLYEALREAGHELMLIVRAGYLPLMPAIAPGVQVVTLEPDPYAPALDTSRLDRLLGHVKRFQPEMLLIAPYQWTVFEEWLAEQLPGVRRVGMKGNLFAGDPRSGVRLQSKMALDEKVEVGENLAEVRKNELLCAALLGRSVSLPRPRLVVTEQQAQMGRAVLQRFGLEPGTYWAACVGHHRFTEVRNWPVRNWIEGLSQWARRHGRRFLLVGSESELPVSREIAAGVESAAAGSAFVADGMDLDTLLGVLQFSAGYVGRDTGPMHMAAAMCKPVLAVFGGGTWPRFLPAAEKSRVLSTSLPCAGCDWICHLPESYCVKSVSTDRFAAAVEDMEAGRISGAEVSAPPADAALQARVILEAAGAARELICRQAAAQRASEQALQQAQQAAEEGEALRRQLGESESQRRSSAAQLAELRKQLFAQRASAADHQAKFSRSSAEQDVLAAELKQLEAEVARLRWKLQQLGHSKWHRLGRALGLRLETADRQGKAEAQRQ